MLERRRIVELWRAGSPETPGTLVTLVSVEGSSYRQPGARLLISGEPQTYAGTISGGCLEADIVKKSQWVTRHGAAVERYSMAFDDTDDIPFGLGCGGTVDILFEPLKTVECDALLRSAEESLEGHELVVTNISAFRKLAIEASNIKRGKCSFFECGSDGRPNPLVT